MIKLASILGFLQVGFVYPLTAQVFEVTNASQDFAVTASVTGPNQAVTGNSGPVTIGDLSAVSPTTLSQMATDVEGDSATASGTYSSVSSTSATTLSFTLTDTSSVSVSSQSGNNAAMAIEQADIDFTLNSPAVVTASATGSSSIVTSGRLFGSGYDSNISPSVSVDTVLPAGNYYSAERLTWAAEQMSPRPTRAR